MINAVLQTLQIPSVLMKHFSKVTVSLNWHTNPLLWTPSSHHQMDPCVLFTYFVGLRGLYRPLWVSLVMASCDLGTASKVQCSAYYSRYERDSKLCQDLEIGKLLS